MKQEYDFSKGERGKFYHPRAMFSFPVYLEVDVDEYLSQLANDSNTNVQQIVNDWLRVNIKLIKNVQPQ